MNKILLSMHHEKLDRKSIIVSIGGGIIGDLTGFAASIYMRGIEWMNIPTTLLAQVDAAVGGKTGCNFLGIKNLIGAFYEPEQIVCNIGFLQSLPHREYISGVAEVVKYAMIADYRFFVWLENNKNAVVTRNKDSLEYLIKKCVFIKKSLVMQDFNDKGIRNILNFGHTFGHALESATNFTDYLHGEAVALGMIFESQLAVKLELLDDSLLNRLKDLLQFFCLGRHKQGANFTSQELLKYMLHDKKREYDKLVFVLPVEIGKVRLIKNIELNLVKGMIEHVSI